MNTWLIFVFVCVAFCWRQMSAECHRNWLHHHFVLYADLLLSFLRCICQLKSTFVIASRLMVAAYQFWFLHLFFISSSSFSHSFNPDAEEEKSEQKKKKKNEQCIWWFGCMTWIVYLKRMVNLMALSLHVKRQCLDIKSMIAFWNWKKKVEIIIICYVAKGIVFSSWAHRLCASPHISAHLCWLR